MVRTRFAPSPTGYLHIGGVRTALFNWLFTRHHGGQFILRIDDTDQQRNVAEALRPILEGFRWLGLDWDEGAEVGGPRGPYYQSQKLPRYQEAVRALLDRGAAYWDYATAEELAAERTAAEKEKRPFVYSRRWLADTPAQRQGFEAQGRKGAVRLKMPCAGVCRIADLVRGEVEVEWALEQDHVVQRADGSVLYNLASVVDDYDMEISHVIRSEEHLSNTPRQVFIAQALGYPLPKYAHLPYVAAPGSKEKLSKRKIPQYLKNPEFKKVYEHGRAIAEAIGHHTSADTFNPVIVDFYREVGYRAEAVLNYLVLLGWALDDKTEFFSRQDMIRLFSLERVNKAPASFDPKKLFAFQERYMPLVAVEEKAARALLYLEKAGLIPPPAPAEIRARLEQIIRAAGERIKVAGDILEYADFFTPDDQLNYDRAALHKQFGQSRDGAVLLKKFRHRLSTAPAFDAATLEALTNDFLQAEGVQLRQIQPLVRLAVTGKTIGFGLYETLELLGKKPCLARIDRVLMPSGKEGHHEHS